MSQEKGFDDYWDEVVSETDESEEVEVIEDNAEEDTDTTSSETDEEEATEKEDTINEEEEHEEDVVDKVDYEALYNQIANESITNQKKYDDNIKNLESKVEELVNDKIIASKKDYSSFWEDYPDFKEPIETLINDAIEVKFIDVDTKIKEVMNQLNTIKTGYEKVEQRSAADLILSAHPDAATISNSSDFATWINSKSKRIADSYIEICKSGTAEEVISMLDDYKKDTGVTKKKKAKKKDAILAVDTKSKPIIPKEGPDSNDFDAAWEEAIRE